MSANTPTRILVVDDDATAMRALCDTLHDLGYDAVGCGGGKQALDVLRTSAFDILLTDVMMPGMTGVQLLTEALKIDSQLLGVLMTGMGTVETAVDAMKAGALDYVLKPIKIKSLLAVIDRALGVRRLRLENIQLRDAIAMHEMSRALAETLDTQVLLERITKTAIQQFDADQASIMLPSEDGRSLRVAAVQGRQLEWTEGMEVPSGAGMPGWVASRCEPLVFDGAFDNPELAHLRPSAAVQAALSVPMVTRARLVGVLNLCRERARRPFTAGQVRVLQVLTTAAAASIESARAYESLRELAAALEQRVADRTAELEAANRNLERFSQSVSHDLRQPLAAINGFAQVLDECHAQGLDPQGRAYLSSVRLAGRRMSQLIDDLLQLARITGADLRRSQVRLSEIAGEIVAGLRRNDPQRQVRFDVQPATAMCDARLVKVALENLLGNAWKFTGRRPQATIEFGCREEQGEVIYHVRDNGAGFEMAYAGRLFRPFQRLHHEGEFPGTGIGLATVQRVIELHGGRIWAEAELDKGAAFFFTLASAAGH